MDQTRTLPTIKNNIQGLNKMPKNIFLSVKINKLFFWYAFFMAFPIIQLVQNISIIFFIVIIYRIYKSNFSVFSFKKGIQKLALLFAIGALLSVLGSYFVGGNEQIKRAFIVFPNYLYWSFLIIFMVNYRYFINYFTVFKGITYGLLLSILYYFFIQKIPFVAILPVFKLLTQNTFAFLLICYVPVTIFYVKRSYGKVISIFLLFVFVIVGFLSGSRSSSVLVVFGAFFTFFLSNNFNYKVIIKTILFASLLFLIVMSDFGKKIVYDLNPETYDLIYNTEDVIETDQSYLARRALVDKGLGLFYEYPLTGIGLNNFASTEGEIAGDFAGAELIINKGFESGKSAHNSYLSILTEGGLFLIVPFLLIIFILIGFFVLKFKKIPTTYRPVFIGLIGMSVHLYFISAILNVFAWFLIALAASMIYRRKLKINQRDI